MKVFVVTACDYGDYSVSDVFAKREDAVAAVEKYKAKEKRARQRFTYEYDVVEHTVK
jgi:hypothetical protein